MVLECVLKMKGKQLIYFQKILPKMMMVMVLHLKLFCINHLRVILFRFDIYL